MTTPEECPDPSAHKIFRYCPYCSWMDEVTDYEAVETAITKALYERRNDAKFIGRLKASIERHGVILDRLAESEERVTSTTEGCATEREANGRDEP